MIMHLHGTVRITVLYFFTLCLQFEGYALIINSQK
jgi:hypothetical protein